MDQKLRKYFSKLKRYYVNILMS